MQRASQRALLHTGQLPRREKLRNCRTGSAAAFAGILPAPAVPTRAPTSLAALGRGKARSNCSFEQLGGGEARNMW